MQLVHEDPSRNLHNEVKFYKNQNKMLIEDIKKQREYEKRLLEIVNRERGGSSIERNTNSNDPAGHSSRGGGDTDRLMGEERVDLAVLDSHRKQISDHQMSDRKKR